MRFFEPTVATVVTNPTNQDLKYTWLGKNGTFVKAKSSITVPFEVYTAATPSQRAQLGTHLKGKLVKLSYNIREIPTKKVKSISTHVVYDKTPAGRATTPPNTKKEKADEDAAAIKAAEEKKAEARTQIIQDVGDGKDAVEDSKDLVQKATGQETVTMQDAMGWEEPPTDDTRQPQEAENVTMNEALTEGVGDPLEKAVEAAEQEKKAAEQKEKLAAAKKPRTRRKRTTKKK
jgi:hypothetical protein